MKNNKRSQNSRCRRNRLNSESLSYGDLEPRKLMAVGAFTGIFDGQHAAFDNGAVVRINRDAQVVTGDWNGNGIETLGIFQKGNWILDRTGNGITEDDQRLSFGWPTDTPVAGDWNGDGIDTVGAFRDGAWYLDHDGDGYTHIRDDTPIWFGFPGDIPVVGNWDGDAAGTDSPGVFRNGTWILDQTGNGYDYRDPILGFGAADAQPFAADWNGDGRDTPGVLQSEGWYFRESNGYVGFMNTPLQFAHNLGTPLAGNGILRPLNATGIDLSASSVTYNPQGPAAQRATVNMHIHNPYEAEGDVAIGLFWSSGPNLDSPFVEPAGEKLFDASGASRSGHVSINFSAEELGSRPAQAKHLIAVVQTVNENNTSNNIVGTEIERKIYLNFDGIDLSQSQLKSWAGSDWREFVDLLDSAGQDGIEVNRFLDGHEHRDAVIRGIHYQLQRDLARYGITVQLTSGGAVTGEGATTLFFGANSLGSNIAGDIDVYNDNDTDIGFIDGYFRSSADLSSDIQRAIYQYSDIALHEAGHTYGLHHVNTLDGNNLYAESMGLSYTVRDLPFNVDIAVDTGFVNRSFQPYVDQDGIDHSRGRGVQNSHERMEESFGYAWLDRSGPEPSFYGNGDTTALNHASLFSHFAHEDSFIEGDSRDDEPGHGPNCGCALCQIPQPAESVSQTEETSFADVFQSPVAKENTDDVKVATSPIVTPVELGLARSKLEGAEPILAADLETDSERQTNIDLMSSNLDKLFDTFEEFEVGLI